MRVQTVIVLPAIYLYSSFNARIGVRTVIIFPTIYLQSSCDIRIKLQTVIIYIIPVWCPHQSPKGDYCPRPSLGANIYKPCLVFTSEPKRWLYSGPSLAANIYNPRSMFTPESECWLYSRAYLAANIIPVWWLHQTSNGDFIPGQIWPRIWYPFGADTGIQTAIIFPASGRFWWYRIFRIFLARVVDIVDSDRKCNHRLDSDVNTKRWLYPRPFGLRCPHQTATLFPAIGDYVAGQKWWT